MRKLAKKSAAKARKSVAKKPAPTPSKPDDILICGEGYIPEENKHLTYLTTGALVVLAIVLSPILIPVWAVGWVWYHKDHRENIACQNTAGQKCEI